MHSKLRTWEKEPCRVTIQSPAMKRLGKTVWQLFEWVGGLMSC